MKNYERLCRVYDLGWGDFARQYLNLINWLLREQGIRQARILDIACGTGILAIALAKRGHHVHGVDVSPRMIAVAESKSAGMANISFEVQDMKRFRAIGSYDLVTCTFDALNYVLREDTLKGLFDRVASALGRSGLYVFDSNATHHFVRREDGSLSQTLRGLSFV
jgi:2-polyprenyl-3-methyl-5-hydroxy-6-metoxy-1,4-benzoquinol methylase